MAMLWSLNISDNLEDVKLSTGLRRSWTLICSCWADTWLAKDFRGFQWWLWHASLPLLARTNASRGTSWLSKNQHPRQQKMIQLQDLHADGSEAYAAPAPRVVSVYYCRCSVNGGWGEEWALVLHILQWKDNNPSCCFFSIMKVIKKWNGVCFKIYH